MVELNAAERRALLLVTILVVLGAAARLGLGPDEATYAWRPGAAAGPGATEEDALAAVRSAVDRNLDRAHRASRPLAPGERLDPNTVDEVELQRLRGVGPATARAIVEFREAGGRFRRPEDLERVPGIGPATLRRIRPHLDLVAPPAPVPAATAAHAALPYGARGRTAGEAPAGRRGSSVDVNSAGPAELERLTGIGPALAAGIVALRERKGRFRRLEELLEVRGIGPETLERIRSRAVVR